MKNLEKRKNAAAMAAVIAYIKAEEEAMASMPAMPMMPAVTVLAAAPPRYWGVSGRQDQMGLRQMMQLRSFGR